MREILFRGIKTETKGEWIEGYFKIMNGKCYIANYDYSPFEVEVYEHTVSQLTGLADKNGVKIFEGDVLLCKKATSPEEKGFECVFRDNAFRFINRNHPNKEHFNIQIDEYDYIKEQLEIIGNIHE